MWQPPALALQVSSYLCTLCNLLQSLQMLLALLELLCWLGRLEPSRLPDADALARAAAMIGGPGAHNGLPPNFATQARALWKHLDELAGRPDEYQ
jgi:hypothetical protein